MTCDKCGSDMTIENAQTACDSGIEHTRWLCRCGRRREQLQSAGPRALGAYWPLDHDTARIWRRTFGA